MIAERWVLFVWAAASLAPWCAVWAARPRLRATMWWSSWFAVPFGLSEPMFAGRYWSPPSLFDLARRLHVDLESFVFLFAAGGLASVACEVGAGVAIATAAPADAPRSRPLRNLAFATPACVFALALLVVREPIVAGVLAMSGGAVARALARRDLARAVVVGAIVFGVYYALLVGSLVWVEPAWSARVWSHAGAARPRFLRIPWAELAFGVSFGAYWSGLREQYRWTFEPRTA